MEKDNLKIQNNSRFIFHIDVNSAFLSWTAVNMLCCGKNEDIRNIPAVIGGDEKSRHGVVLAKSNSAKTYGIITGESLFSARRKCPELKIYPSSFKIYNECSCKMMELIKGYTPFFLQYSIDECFVDVTNVINNERINLTNKERANKLAIEIKEKIKNELGFTVNVGISSNKILAKMASELRKPDMVNTLYTEEIESKLWPLPVSELFMVGKSAKDSLNKMYINTIGELANYSLEIIQTKFKSYGKMIWEYANGMDDSIIELESQSEMKVISNSTTLAEDISSMERVNIVLLELSENICTRLRKESKLCKSVSVSIRDNKFNNYSHQKSLNVATDSTKIIYETAQILFKEIWKRKPIRLIGIQLSKLNQGECQQISLFDDTSKKDKALDKVIDEIREKYGDKAIVRTVFLDKNDKK